MPRLAELSPKYLEEFNEILNRYLTKQKIKARKTIMFNVYIYVREDI